MLTFAPPASRLGQNLLDTYRHEHCTTMKVLRAYPSDKLALQPHGKCKNARDLAWMFVLEKGLAIKALTTGLDWSRPPSMPAAPETMDEILSALDEAQDRLMGIINEMTDDDFVETVQFPTGPRVVGDIAKGSFLWMMLHDHIHHRGQFSIYLRMADGKVPSIYGPTADEPWM